VVLSGTIAADADPVLKTWAFDDPARFARTAFIEALQRAGVKVANVNATGPNPEGRLPSQRAVTALPAVAELPSLSLKEEATYVLKVSYNRGAQTMICLLAVAAGSRDCQAGMAKAAQIWKGAGLNTDDAVLIDGSGLTGNLITADNEVQLQTIMAKRPDADAWRSTLPILGVDGSLSSVQAGTPAAGHVFAKTGTLAQADFFHEKGIRFLFPAKALGGYIDAKSGRRLAFSIVAANSLFTTIEGAFEANDDVGKVAAIIQQSF
jgi:D-alanyl-D-alanine carboxypeptidase/D-alanyl-D-alanine-endopeptidase (penicillin-binding protein 4)